MENNNICKVTDIISGDLICTDFVYEETDVQSSQTFAHNYVLGFIISGVGVMTQSNNEVPLAKGNAFFIPKHTYFSIKGEKDFTYFYISFYGRRADELTERFGLSDRFCVFELNDRYEQLLSFEMDCLKRATDENSDILAECGLLYLLSHLDAKKRKSDSLLYNILGLTNQNFTDSSFSLTVLSQMMGYDTKYLSFFFKKSKGICFSQYLRDIRIKHSIFLMEQGITSVKNIALLSGFGDALYFSKIFKKEIGKTPKEYISHISSNTQN